MSDFKKRRAPKGKPAIDGEDPREWNKLLKRLGLGAKLKPLPRKRSRPLRRDAGS